ncbi:MAG: hypothetical protein A2104_06650 [Candidatus Melainabacteria bacterium GWF2_32_7]|nr:MAG: hypothetical protein A2104_06650 [Candidatus Melainabacteria bacterium GWF2_32_7]
MILRKIFSAFLIAIFISISQINAELLANTNNDGIYKISTAYLGVTPVDIDNFARVDDYFYRGSQPDNYDIKALSSLGIKTIINLRKPTLLNRLDILRQKIIASSFSVNYINIPMSPRKPPTKQQIDYFLKLVNNPDNLPVYVHCAQGKDRTGIMTAIYRVNKYGWGFDQTYREMKYRGYHSFIFPSQKDFLAEYIKSLYKDISSN